MTMVILTILLGMLERTFWPLDSPLRAMHVSPLAGLCRCTIMQLVLITKKTTQKKKERKKGVGGIGSCISTLRDFYYHDITCPKDENLGRS